MIPGSTDYDRWIIITALTEFAETEDEAADSGDYPTAETGVYRSHTARARELADLVTTTG